MGVTTMAIAERKVQWIPKGWDRSSKKECIVRDGEISNFEMPLLEGYFLNKDIDGAIEFLKAIKRAMAKTKK